MKEVAVYPEVKTSWYCECPYCGAHCDLNDQQDDCESGASFGIDCPKCKQRFIARGSL